MCYKQLALVDECYLVFLPDLPHTCCLRIGEAGDELASPILPNLVQNGAVEASKQAATGIAVFFSIIQPTRVVRSRSA